MEPIRISYFSDVLCIWAYVAQIRLDQLQATFQDKIAFEYHFVSVFGNAPEKLADRWRDRGGLQGYRAHIEEIVEKFDHLTLHPQVWNQVVPPSSLSCHLFLHGVQLLEKKGLVPASEKLFEKTIWAFRQAFFGESANIADRRVQVEIAASLGLPIPLLEQLLSAGEPYAELAKDFDRVKVHGVSVSPTLIFNEGRQRLNGNVGYRVIAANIRELLHNPGGEASWC
ncbi:MAG: DsbA family protein [Cyanobacteria bacterium REEB459]|nr:DsbA family protein [Cyanobacteria bacterium REEB459]